MNNGTQNLLRVRLDTFLAHSGRIVGWIGIVFWALIGAVGFGELLHGDAASTVDRVMPFVCLGMAGLHVLLVCSASRVRDLVRDFRLYSAVLARDVSKSVLHLSQELNLPLEMVLQRLQKMCRRGYFNGYLSMQDQRLCLLSDGASAPHVVFCPGCGARNAVKAIGDACRYCGAPLSHS